MPTDPEMPVDSEMPFDPEMTVYDRAANWAARLLDEGGLSALEEAELEAWLARDDRHQAALNACLELESDLASARGTDWADRLIAETEAELGPVPDVASQPQAQPRFRAAGGTRTWLPAGVAAIAAALVLAIAMPALLGPSQLTLPQAGPAAQQVAEYRTEHGERRELALDDGSVVALNTRSHLTTAFRDHERRVSLVSGEALFDVAHDPSRPFIVEVGGHEVRAVGTSFDVYARDDGRTVVTVVEGLVETRTTSGPPATALLRPGDRIELVPGDRLPAPSRVDATAATAWRHGMLVFDDRPLEDIVSEFHRYTAFDIRFAQADLGALRMSGSFNLEDIDAFFAALEATRAVTVDASEDGRRIVIRSAGDTSGQN
jgi:transmembrane sensor